MLLPKKYLLCVCYIHTRIRVIYFKVLSQVALNLSVLTRCCVKSVEEKVSYGSFQ